MSVLSKVNYPLSIRLIESNWKVNLPGTNSPPHGSKLAEEA